MGSQIIGRAECPWCGFASAHVKESERCVYMYCPGCGTNGPHARTNEQRANMTKRMRPTEPAPTPTVPTPTGKRAEVDPPPADPATPPNPPPTPPAPPAKRRSLFG